MSRNEDDIYQENMSFLRARMPSRSAGRRRSPSNEQTRQHIQFDEDPASSTPDEAIARESAIDTPSTAGADSSNRAFTRNSLRRLQRQGSPRSPAPTTPSNFGLPLPAFYGWTAVHPYGDTNGDADMTDVFDMWRGSLANDRETEDANEWRNLLRNERNMDRDRRLSGSGGRTGTTNTDTAARAMFGDPSAISTADLLQSVRRRPQLSSRARAHNVPLSNYILEHERAMAERRGDRRGRTHNRRLELGSPRRKSSVAVLQDAIDYLDQLKDTTEKGIWAPDVSGRLADIKKRSNDFVEETNSIAPQTHCSFLHPGLSFEGSQHATHLRPASLSREQAIRRRISGLEPIYFNTRSDGSHISVFATNSNAYFPEEHDNESGSSDDDGSGRLPRAAAAGSGTTGGAQDGQEGDDRFENWPVKVTLHDVDLEKMTLCGTMEAYNIPDKSSPDQDGVHIVTFLEGEIIDFKTHTLRTKNFKSTLEKDASYWHSLEPFRDMSEEQMAECLLSEKYLQQTLGEKYLLMRWKERCFVSPSHSRQGLTISGFYYICLRRWDGHFEGMYYDDGSSPYQLLNLDPVNKGMLTFPSVQVR